MTTTEYGHLPRSTLVNLLHARDKSLADKDLEAAGMQIEIDDITAELENALMEIDELRSNQ